MTVSSQTYESIQSGNNVTLAFTVPFRILAKSHLLVVITDADNIEHVQTVDSDYTVSNIGSTNTTVTFASAPASTETVTFTRSVPITQETDYVENDPFPADSHETALDKLTMICQQLYGYIQGLTADVADIILQPAEDLYDDRYLRLIGGLMLADGALDGIHITPDVSGNLEIEPQAANGRVKIHVDSAASDNGGVAMGRALMRVPIKSILSGLTTADAIGGDDFNQTQSGSWASAKVNCANTSAAIITIVKNSDMVDPASYWKKGDYFTVCQKQTGSVTLAVDTGTLHYPSDLAPTTRARYACITATCDDPSANTWTISGDLDAA